MATLEEIRTQYPAYKDMPDADLANALYDKFYKDIPRDQFNQKIGLSAQPTQAAPKPKEPFNVLPLKEDDAGNINFDSDAGLMGVIKRTFMAPGEAYRGELDPNSEEGRARALEAASVMSPGAALRGRMAPRPAPATAELRAGSDAAAAATETSPFGNARALATDAATDQAARATKAKVIEDAIDRAKLRTKGRGFDDAIRQQFRALSENEGAMAQFTEQERADIAAFARGGMVRNVLARIGQLSPTAGRMSSAMGQMSTPTWLGAAGGAAATGTLPALAGAAAGTMAARGGANALARRAANRVSETVRGGALGSDAAAGVGDLSGRISAINDQISELIRQNKGSLPRTGQQRYAEFARLRDERNQAFREMQAMRGTTP